MDKVNAVIEKLISKLPDMIGQFAAFGIWGYVALAIIVAIMAGILIAWKIIAQKKANEKARKETEKNRDENSGTLPKDNASDEASAKDALARLREKIALSKRKWPDFVAPYEIKTENIRAEFEALPKILQDIFLDLGTFSYVRYGIPLTITRIFEKVDIVETGVHEAGRAIDIRDVVKNERGEIILRTFTPGQVDEMLKYINEKYRRTDGLKCLIHHDGTAPHFHLQMPYDWLTEKDLRSLELYLDTFQK